MKKIKLKFIGFWSDFVDNDNLFFNILSKYYNIEISEEPDYVICSPLCKPFEYMKYDCIRILFSGENYSPDFNAFDYAIGFDNIKYNDRFYRFPLYLYDNKINQLEDRNITRREAKEALESKEYFCNFIYSHRSSHGLREEILEKLLQYKHVECAGTYKNNMIDNFYAKNYREKIDFLKKCKFTIAFESTELIGFSTEKIIHPYYALSIPIYFGNKDVSNDFNEKSFINCHSFDSLDDVIERVREIDENDDLYLDMIQENVFNDNKYISTSYDGLEEFLCNIFNQDKNNAYRRPLFYAGEMHNKCLYEYNRFSNHILYKIWNKLFNR